MGRPSGLTSASPRWEPASAWVWETSMIPRRWERRLWCATITYARRTCEGAFSPTSGAKNGETRNARAPLDAKNSNESYVRVTRMRMRIRVDARRASAFVSSRNICCRDYSRSVHFGDATLLSRDVPRIQFARVDATRLINASLTAHPIRPNEREREDFQLSDRL